MTTRSPGNWATGPKLNPSQAWGAHTPENLDPTAADVLAEISLPRAWRRRWAESPRSVVAEEPGGRTLTAEELEARSADVARRLAGAGLTSGDRVVLSASASIDMLIAYVAAHRLGVVLVPMNAGYGPREIAHIVGNTEPKAALVDDAQRAAVISEVSSAPIAVSTCDVSWAPASGDVELDASDSNTPALICHTSGTTGKPKGAVLTSGNLLASAQAVRLAWRWEPADRLALALPLFHLHGLGVGLNGTLVSGGTVLLLGQFSPQAISDAAAEARATMFFGVPTMYHRLVESSFAASLSDMRLCVSGSAPLAAELYGRIRVATGQRVIERYGMTETVMNLSNPYDGERRPGTVGFPLPGVEVRLDAGAGSTGEIEIRGPNVFVGYLNDPDATSQAHTPDGWFRSGDIGSIDEDGYVRIVGRSKELIISGGYNVYPREVEDVLLEHPRIAEVAVVGAPSAEWGEVVTAVVVRGGEIESDEVIAHAASRLASYKRPRQVRFVDTLPRNALGKVQRSLL